MSQPRGNRHQRELIALARKMAEADGGSVCLGSSTGSELVLFITAGDGRTKRTLVHGTPRNTVAEMRKAENRINRFLKGQ